MVEFWYVEACGQCHTCVQSAHSYNLRAQNRQNPLIWVVFVILSTVVVAEDKEERKTQSKSKSSCWMPWRWVQGSEDEKQGECKEWGEWKQATEQCGCNCHLLSIKNIYISLSQSFCCICMWVKMNRNSASNVVEKFSSLFILSQNSLICSLYSSTK